MIFYGTKSTHLLTASLPNACAHCGSTQTVHMSVFQKYGHVYGIPFLPMGKVLASECSHCRQVLNENEMPPSWATDTQEVKSQAKIPFWTFSGLGLVVVLVAVFMWMGKENAAQNAQWIVTPQQGDIYKVKTEEGNYTLYKVHAVTTDSVAVLINQYEASLEKGLSKIKAKGDAAFYPEPFSIDRTKLKSMLDKGEIIDIDRK